MGVLNQIRRLVENGLYYLTNHAVEEADLDEIDIYDVENVLLHGKIRKTWPVEGKVEVVGRSLAGIVIGVVCRITKGRKVRVITVYEDQ